MKKLFTSILPFLALLGLTACNAQKPIALVNGEDGKLINFTGEGLSAFNYGPTIARVKLLDGDPQFKVITVNKDGNIKAGFWESTKGKWHFANGNDHWEYCHIVSGVSIITQDGGKPQTYKAGDSFILLPGFSGTWEVVENTRKEYVIAKPTGLTK